MSAIITAVVSVTSIGVICAAILSIASKFMYVKIDDRIALLSNIMPGANCGACGYPGCSAYASALIEENAKSNLCAPGGASLLAKISEILGVEAAGIEAKMAVISCRGSGQNKKMKYNGIESCMAAKNVFKGESSCAFSCLGYGDCKVVCPSDAICVEGGLARVIAGKCTGCGLCVKTCPSRLISIEKADIPVIIACKNIEKGAITRKKCASGCIACTKCVKECPQSAITITDNIAVIDYNKCDGCGKCASVCITKCIKLLLEKNS
ncbi:MAG: RnfABCDGE type electron transport complex subunit B [Treponema sp.]|nr:RnfABCDGE type electron transport complex subunit B [Treponema sp.]